MWGGGAGLKDRRGHQRGSPAHYYLLWGMYCVPAAQEGGKQWPTPHSDLCNKLSVEQMAWDLPKNPAGPFKKSL